MNTALVLDAIEHAIWTRSRDGITDLSGLIHHHDMGPLTRLLRSPNGLYKTELNKPRGPCRTADQVEIATLEWIDWFNHRLLYEHCGDVPPAELEAAYDRHDRTRQPAEFSNK